MNGWYPFYLYFGLSILWFLLWAFSFYVYTVMRGREKVLARLWAGTVWVATILAVSIVTMLALGGR